MAQSGAHRAIASLAVDRAEPFDSMSSDERSLRDALRLRGRQAGDRLGRSKGTQGITRLAHEVACEHWHRMLFARFLAENELLIAPEYGVAVSLEDCRELGRELERDPWELAGKWAQKMLPGVFVEDDPAIELALPPETRQNLEEILESLPATIFTAQDSLGWTYQYWRSEEKDRVNRSGGKVGADELPAVTQLFTERYMVLFLLHNSIGAWWAGKMLAEDPVLAASDAGERTMRGRTRIAGGGGYDFTYLRFMREKAPGDGEDDRSGPWRPAAGSFPEWPRKARDLRVLDPCCGSGHFLVEAFELLVRLRMDEEGLATHDAIRAVLRENLFGLEIDPRCTQIAAFNLALAAWRMAGRQIELPAVNIACCGIAPHASEERWVRLAEDLELQTGMALEPNLFGAPPSLAREPLREGMAGLHRLFGQARDLGSLIEPKAGRANFYRAGYDYLKDLLDAAIEDERQTGGRNERAVAAAGMARAAEIVTGRYTLVITNVPFLARGKQGAVLRKFAATHHGDAKGDIATVFVSRIFQWLETHGTQALVTPQNWLFLTTYRKLRERLLQERTWNVVARLGEHAFADSQAAGAFAALAVLSAGKPEPGWQMAGLDVSAQRGQRPIRAAEKARLLGGGSGIVESVQADQLGNPGARVIFSALRGKGSALSSAAIVAEGLHTGDYWRFGRKVWELPLPKPDIWSLQQGGTSSRDGRGGCEHALLWERGDGSLMEFVRMRLQSENTSMWIKGEEVWGKGGIAVGTMGEMRHAAYHGAPFTHGIVVLSPHDQRHLASLVAYVESEDFRHNVRVLDQKISVARSTFAQVPFEVNHWTKVAAERYPNGLPEPYSDDPTQWIFHGDPCRSVIWDEHTKLTALGPTRFDHTVLQVAVARLLGYRWPAELDPAMRLATEQRATADACATYSDLADADGIVCLSPTRGEMSAADRLRTLLIRTYGDKWSAATERQLLSAANPTGRTPRSLEHWLRDRFFLEHCKLFHNRPFIWHVWDGRKDGFHALVNYHRLAGPNGEGRRILKSLAYAYLNDWILRQRAERQAGTPGSDARIEHALVLRQQLERILEGEPPCDIFVRWKPLHAQAVGWDPDLDDGVRLNIRPFMRAALRKGGRAGAGILRWKPNVKWGKDRGKEPEEPRPRGEFPWFWSCPGRGSVAVRTDFEAEKRARFDGQRWNDLHYTRAAKAAAREQRRILREGALR